MTKFYKNQFFWITLGFTALVAWGFVIAQKTQNTESASESSQTLQEKTTERARLVGKTLIESKFVRKVFTPAASTPQARGLASVSAAVANKPDFEMLTVEEGQIGRDAWGFPLQYRKVKNKLFIWSLGPNHTLDSSINQIESSTTQGDDLVVTIAI